MVGISTATTGEFKYEENRDNEDIISMMVMNITMMLKTTILMMPMMSRKP